MSSITAQQTKLNLELVPNEKRLEIRKYNGRLNPIKIQREPRFQVVLDALALTPCYFAFLTTANILLKLIRSHLSSHPIRTSSEHKNLITCREWLIPM
ncbi:hypothetical protein Tco_0226316 [Tanacetum coccineum]